jgi:hypothetical protein
MRSLANFCFLSKVATIPSFFASSTYWVLSPPQGSSHLAFEGL